VPFDFVATLGTNYRQVWRDGILIVSCKCWALFHSGFLPNAA